MKTLTIALFIALKFISFSQERVNDKYKVNFNYGAYASSYTGVNGGIGFYKKNGLSLDVDIAFGKRTAQDKPRDYNNGLSTLLTFGLDKPRDFFSSQSLLIGKGFSTKNSSVNFIIKGGISNLQFTDATNFKAKSQNGLYEGLFGSNYDYSSELTQEIGFVLTADLQLIFSKAVGLTISPRVIINDHSTEAGISLKLMFGKVR